MTKRKLPPLRSRSQSEHRFLGRRGERAIPVSHHAERDDIMRRVQEQRTKQLAGAAVDLYDTPIIGDTTLPFHKKKKEFIKAVVDNRVTLLGGETGSGKTTEGALALSELRDDDGNYYFDKVITLLPRRMIVDGLAAYERAMVARAFDEATATALIGLAHSERVELGDENRIVFMTPGTYMRMADRIADEYQGKRLLVMPDEIHEANFPMELAIATVASQILEHDGWRMVLSSATHDAEAVDRALEKVNGVPIPHIYTEGRPYKLEFHERIHMMAAEDYASCGKDHEKSLVFVAGKQEIDDTIDAMYKALGRDARSVVFRKLHAKMTREMIRHVNDPVGEGQRLVIVATNAAESGMTFPGNTLVIADGYVRRNELGNEGAPGLLLCLAARSELIQMGGRAGRDIGGGEFHLVAGLDGKGVCFDSPERDDHPPAEIYQTNLALAALTTVALNKDLGYLNNFTLHPVRGSSIINANETLLRLGAVDNEYRITSRGIDMNLFPLRPELSRAVVEAWRVKRRLETIARTAIVASAIEAGGLQYYTRATNDSWKGLLRETTADDIIAQYDLMRATEQYYDGTHVDEEALLQLDIDPKNAYRAHRQLGKVLRAIGISLSDIHLSEPTPDEEQDIRDCMTAGMVDMIYRRLQARRHEDGPIYANVLSGRETTVARALSDRSQLAGDPSLIAAWPRWYEIHRKPNKQERDEGANPDVKIREVKHIVEMAMPITVDMLRSHVADLVVPHATASSIRGGKVIERAELRYGTLTLGTVEKPVTSEMSEIEKQQLIDHIQSHPTESLIELRTIKKLLENTWQHTPENLRVLWERPVLKDQDIRQMLAEATKHAHNVGEVDNALREMIHLQGIVADYWISDQARSTIRDVSPDEITILDQSAEVYYHEGHAYITKMPPIDISQLPDTLQLPDGRDVLVQAVVSRRGKARMTIAEYKSLKEV
ncbi:MAG: hypothetical protein KA604_02190 [Candidatus Saccharimonas sp.]|nr:hypothetical protein [Candidatus Saccharimonas sp.]